LEQLEATDIEIEIGMVIDLCIQRRLILDEHAVMV